MNEKCDPYDHKCRPKCTQNADCNGVKMTCDTSNGLCVPSKIPLLYYYNTCITNKVIEIIIFI